VTRRAAVLSALVALGALSTAVMAAQHAGHDDQKVVTLQRIKDNLYLATGGGGNTAVFITDLGVVLVDTKLPGWGQPLAAKIRTITDKPIATIINTHAHIDHVGSNEFFGTAVEIVAQEHTRRTMDRMDAFNGEKASALPKLTYRDTMTIDGVNLEFYHWAPGHTSGDAWVVFSAARVVHAGDLFARTEPPMIDNLNGGSGLAYPETLAKAAAGIKDVVTIITGHGTLRPWKDLATTPTSPRVATPSSTVSTTAAAHRRFVKLPAKSLKRRRRTPFRKVWKPSSGSCPGNALTRSAIQESCMTTRARLSSLGAIGAIVAALLRLSATAQQPDACQRLATTALPNATITGATRVDAGTFSPPAGRRGASEPYADLGAFCRITTTTPVTPASTAHTEIWLPIGNWNHESRPAGGGFYGGTMPYARMREIVRGGSATSGSDAGIDGIGALTQRPELMKNIANAPFHAMVAQARRWRPPTARRRA
jgi:glyoxylase-like metal-dependent hydrolase (beta-lactamase superfamily II)